MTDQLRCPLSGISCDKCEILHNSISAKCPITALINAIEKIGKILSKEEE